MSEPDGSEFDAIAAEYDLMYRMIEDAVLATACEAGVLG